VGIVQDLLPVFLISCIDILAKGWIKEEGQ